MYIYSANFHFILLLYMYTSIFLCLKKYNRSIVLFRNIKYVDESLSFAGGGFKFMLYFNMTFVTEIY